MASKNRKKRKLLARAKRLAKQLGVTMDQAADLAKNPVAIPMTPKTAPTPPPSPAATLGAVTRKVECHKGPRHVFTLGLARVFAGAENEMRYAAAGRWKLLISCAGPNIAPVQDVQVNPEARALLDPEFFEGAVTPFVAIDWPDGGVPYIGLRQWGALAVSIAKIDGDVGLYCMGGHGRTGTALSILAALGGLVGKTDDPVEWVRKRYCSNAVESDKQVQYIERMTGLTVKAEPSMDDIMNYYGYGSGGGWNFTGTNNANSYTKSGGYQVMSKGETPLNTNIVDTAAQLGLPIRPDGRVGIPIVNRAGDIIGYDYTAKDFVPGTMIEASTEEETEYEELQAYLRDNAIRDDDDDDLLAMDTKTPWQKWGT